MRDQETQCQHGPAPTQQLLHTSEPAETSVHLAFLPFQEPRLPDVSAPYAFPNRGNGNFAQPGYAPSHEVPDLAHKVNSCDVIELRKRSETADQSVQVSTSTAHKSIQTEPLTSLMLCDKATNQSPIMCDKAIDQNPITEKAVTNHDNCVRILSLSDSDGPAAPVMITCNEKQLCTALEPPEPNCQETMISVHLLLSVEQQTRPNLTLHDLKEELCRNRHLQIASRPLPQ